MPCAMLRPWFRGGCHACFCRPDGWVPSVLVLCKHEVSPWLPKRTARSAPPSFSPPSRKLPPAAAQKFQTAYHLMFDCEQLQTPLLDTTTALIERRSCGMVRVAWTEFGSVGVGRRAALGQNDKSSEGSGHPGQRAGPRLERGEGLREAQRPGGVQAVGGLRRYKSWERYNLYVLPSPPTHPFFMK